MVRFSSSRNTSVLLALSFCAAAAPLQVPAGAEIQARLKTKVSTQTAKAKDPVEAVVIAPVMVSGQFAIPAGALVRGTVEKASQSSKGDERSMLALSFTELEMDGVKLKIAGHDSAIEIA